jgi:hypothetical protein
VPVLNSQTGQMTSDLTASAEDEECHSGQQVVYSRLEGLNPLLRSVRSSLAIKGGWMPEGHPNDVFPAAASN